VPIYEYRCPSCGHEKAEMRRVNERLERLECPECGSNMLLEISQTSFSLRGGGWADEGYGSVRGKK
jgi:putative FmdB family regulatory protein